MGHNMTIKQPNNHDPSLKFACSNKLLRSQVQYLHRNHNSNPNPNPSVLSTCSIKVLRSEMQHAYQKRVLKMAATAAATAAPQSTDSTDDVASIVSAIKVSTALLNYVTRISVIEFMRGEDAAFLWCSIVER